jgi:hypothetical protein
VRRPGGRFEFLLDGFHLAPELLVGGQGFLEGPTRELAQLDGGHDAYGQSTEGLKVLLPPRLGPGVLRGAGRDSAANKTSIHSGRCWASSVRTIRSIAPRRMRRSFGQVFISIDQEPPPKGLRLKGMGLRTTGPSGRGEARGS